MEEKEFIPVKGNFEFNNLIKDSEGRAIGMKGKSKLYPVIDVPANGNPDWYKGARSMLFVYSKYKGNFILRGFRGEVDEYLKKHYTHYFCYVSMWSNGKSRGHWNFWKSNVYISKPAPKSRICKRYKYEFHQTIKNSSYMSLEEFGVAKKTAEKNKLVLKRMPHHWIPEFDRF